MSTRATLAIVTTVTGSALALTLAAPMAHANPADPVVAAIMNQIQGDRRQYNAACKPFEYDRTLEAEAERITPGIPQPGGLASSDEIREFHGEGDNRASAVNAAYKDGAGSLVGNCDWTRFGVSFMADNGLGRDAVSIVFSKPATAPKPVEPANPGGPNPGTNPGGPNPGGNPVVPPPPTPVTNAITLSFGPVQHGSLFPPKESSITATVKNSSDLPGDCQYTSTPGGLTDQPFTVGPKGSTPLTFTGIETGTTYTATVVCNDASHTQTQPIGTAKTNVKF